MTSEFLSMVSARDPQLAETLRGRIEQLRAMDAALVRAAEDELADLRRERPRFVAASDRQSVGEFFNVKALPDASGIERLFDIGRRSWLIVEKLARRSHE